MSELQNAAASQNGRAISWDGNRGAELAAQADLMLAHYPADVREQITELLRVLAAQPGEPEIRVR
jgi:hypothetical protein